MEPLDLPDPVVGFRYWDVADGRLLPVARAEPWAPGTVEARCFRHGPAHEAPVPTCGCGLYALHEVPDQVEGTVRGAVTMWGRLAVHGTGVRAQFAKPVALVRGDLSASALEQLARTYAIPVVAEDALREAAAEWGTVVPRCERPYSPLDLLVDVLNRVGLQTAYVWPSRHGSMTRLLLDLLDSFSGSRDAGPRPGESWASWWCRGCDAAAIGHGTQASPRQVAALMGDLPSSDAVLDTPRVSRATGTTRGHEEPGRPEPTLDSGGYQSLAALLEALVVGLEREPVPVGAQEAILPQSAPLTVASIRSEKAIARPADAQARLAIPAARGWCTPEEEALALQIALEEDDDALLRMSIPLVADLLPRERLVAVLVAARSSRTVTGALRRLQPAAARTVADAVLERAEFLFLHSETLLLATDDAARVAIQHDLNRNHPYRNAGLLQMKRVRELVPDAEHDSQLLAAARLTDDPAIRLSCLSALSEDIASVHIERLLRDAADAPGEAWTACAAA